MEQSGSDPNLQEFHPVKNSQHAGIEALSLSQHASFDNVDFNLESNDCIICDPCYRDYSRNKNNRYPGGLNLGMISTLVSYVRQQKHVAVVACVNVNVYISGIPTIGMEMMRYPNGNNICH